MCGLFDRGPLITLYNIKSFSGAARREVGVLLGKSGCNWPAVSLLVQSIDTQIVLLGTGIETAISLLHVNALV